MVRHLLIMMVQPPREHAAYAYAAYAAALPLR